MNVKVHMDTKAFVNKPNRGEIRQINTRIVENVEEVSIQELALYVGQQGHTFMPAIMEGTRQKENFREQQVFALDFDGGISVSDFMVRAEQYEVLPAFVYETFSSTEEIQKFRAVFVNDCVFENRKAVELMNEFLLAIFPEADSCCRDAARMFFGGKNLRYLNEDSVINIRDVAVSMQAYIKKMDETHYARRIKQIGKKHGVYVNKGVLHILSGAYENGENRIFSNRVILGEIPNSPLFYYYKPSTAPKEYVAEKSAYKDLQGISKEKLVESCPLYRDFCEGEISHQHKFLLATNLVHIKGGRSLFLDEITEHEEKWEADWRTIKANEYSPQSCKNGECPYASACRCKNLYEKLQRKIILKNNEDKYLSLAEGERLLTQYLNDAVYNPAKDICIIKAQTSLGKTHTYCQMVQQRDTNMKPILIAAPSVKLQEEIFESLSKKNVDVYKTISLRHMLPRIGLQDLKEEVQELYDHGFGFEVKDSVKNYVKNQDNKLHFYQQEMLEAYLEGKNNLDGSCHIVTTHAMFMALPVEVLRQYEVIVDEDILFSIFKNTSCISFDELRMLCESAHISAYHKKRLFEILQLPDGAVEYTGLSPLEIVALKGLFQDEIPIQSSVANFFESSTLYINAAEQCVNFFTAKQLPNVPTTIVSATINQKLCERYFKGRRIDFWEIPLILYEGRLKQYSAYSMSRSFINSVGWDAIKNSIEKLIGGSLGNTVTFKMIDETKDIYFGKSEGFNGYQGQDLCVIGTPHNVPFIYRLIGKHLGYRVDENMCRRRVQNDWCSFQIMTFESKDMQNLQFYFLESELEQSIGRARLLRNDCTVYLFSNYPCRQAEIIQEDYLVK